MQYERTIWQWVGGGGSPRDAWYACLKKRDTILESAGSDTPDVLVTDLRKVLGFRIQQKAKHLVYAL